MTRPIRSFPDEVEMLATALRDELLIDPDDVADFAVGLIGSQWFTDLIGLVPCERYCAKSDCGTHPGLLLADEGPLAASSGKLKINDEDRSFGAVGVGGGAPTRNRATDPERQSEVPAA